MTSADRDGNRWLPVGRRPVGRLAIGIALVLLVGACGRGTVEVPVEVGSSSSGSLSSAPPDASGADSPGSAPSGSSPEAVGSDGLPGEPYENGPQAGQSLAVVGIAAGLTLPVQVRPGTPSGSAPAPQAVTSLPPLAAGVRATGRARLIEAPSGTARAAVWAEVTAEGSTGWADATHLALLADVTDLTAEVTGRLGRALAAPTMLELGRAVAQTYVSTEPPSTVVVSVNPTTGDLGEITLDVVGLGDDSVAAMRLHVFGTPGTGSFALKSVEGTPFCYRGVSATGRCV